MAALTTETFLPWLQKNKDLLNLAGIATAAGISPVTLRAYVGGGRVMPDKVAEQLLAVLRESFKDLYEQQAGPKPEKLKPGAGVKAFVAAIETAKKIVQQ